MIQTRYLFAIDANGRPTAGTVLEYDDTPITVTNPDGTKTTKPAPVPAYPPEYTREGDINVWQNQNRAKWDATKKAFVLDPVDTAAALKNAQNAKIDELKAAEASALTTFTSAALGPLRTYLSGVSDMLLLNGEFTFVNSALYDNLPIKWYTVEAGNVDHNKTQFNQVFVDGRNWVANTKYKRAIKEAQAQASTSPAQVATITFNNTTPPSVPAGLAGTAGTGQVALTWTANTDVTMLYGGGYNVYKGGVKVNTALVTTTSFTVTGLTAATAYSFAVAAVDTDGNESAKTAAISVTSN